MSYTDQKKTLQLTTFTFDPLIEEPDIPKDLLSQKTSDESEYYIIQFNKSLSHEERLRIQSQYDLRLINYIPDYAYLEKINQIVLKKVKQDVLFRAYVPYHPAFKIDPEIGKHIFVSERRKSEPGLLLLLTAFEDANLEDLANSIRELGFEVVSITNESKMNILRLTVRVTERNDVNRISLLRDVKYIEEVGDVTLNNGTTSWVLQTNVTNSRTIWAHGLRGEGQIIGHIDGALDMNHCFFQDPTNNIVRPSHRKVVGLRNVAGGALFQDHGTFSAGCAAGEDFNNDATSAAPNANNGNAPRARLTHGYLNDLQWLGGTASFYNYLVQAHTDEAHIHTNSWDDKSTSAYTQLSVDLDQFAWDYEDDLVIIGPDNGGTIRPPDTSKNALVVNATRQNPNQTSFSSGITMFSLDGRRKPDLMAPGQNIVSSDDGTACGTRTASGTSFAAPAVAGAASLARQYYTEGWYPTGALESHHSFIPSGALLKATLLNATVDMTGIPGYPGSNATGEGWGRLLLENALYFEGDARNLRVWDTRHADGLTTGVTHTHHIDIATNTQPLKVTLVWTEPPGAASSSNPVVNNLDLQVVSPGGAQTFLGNVFSGGVSATGGTADSLNSVEMVVVNNPTPGDWTMRVIGTAVNVGNPGQGYALVVTADLTEPPVTTGVQDTLVVRAKFADISSEPSLPNLQNKMTDVVNYIKEVSYGGATINRIFRGPLNLDYNKDYYYHPDRNLLIELTQEVVAKLVSAEPTLFNTLERMIIVTNDINFTGDWATTGPWPYELPTGFTRPISVSIQSYDNSVARFTHGLLHQFNLVDLYAHEGVTFPRPYVDEWDNMGGQYNNAHPLIWSKERAGWLTAHHDTIQYIPRPTAGTSYTGTNPIPIFRNTSTSTNRKGIAIGLSQGAATLASENKFYFVEARSNASGTFDRSLPGSGVLIYYVNELVPQGEGPVILRDKNLMTPGLSDAFFTVGDVVEIPGTGIKLTVLAGTGGANFNIRVDYTAPTTDYNVYITRGDTIAGQFYSYMSPDIWVDSPKNGFNLSGGPPPSDQPENPVARLVNRIYARVHNTGPATAFDFDVRFRISEPYHTVGGEEDFDKFVGIKHIPSLGPGAETGSELFVEWTPEGSDDPHACVMVDLINLVGTDTNVHDNWAQENLQIVASVTSSPFHPVTYSYNLTNPYEQSSLFYFRADGAPEGWDVELNPYKIRLNPGERMVGQAIITPPTDAQVCTSERIQITTWTPRGDTLINVGGAVVQVDLRRPTVINMDVKTRECDRRDWDLLDPKGRIGGLFEPAHRKGCGRMTVHGCTDPPMAGQEIILKYVDPTGNVTYHTVKTDENGCFDDFFVSVIGGTWQVSAEYPGGECNAPVVEGPFTVCWCYQ
jgi:Subtilase family